MPLSWQCPHPWELEFLEFPSGSCCRRAAMGCPGLFCAPGPGSPRPHKQFVPEALGWSSSTHRDTLPLPAVPATLQDKWHSQDICSPTQALPLWFSPHRACRTQPDPSLLTAGRCSPPSPLGSPEPSRCLCYHPFMTSPKTRGLWHTSRGGCKVLGCQDNPLWLPPLLAEISLQGHCLQVLS